MCPWNKQLATSDVLQTVRAVPDFHNKPFYEFLQVRVGGEVRWNTIALSERCCCCCCLRPGSPLGLAAWTMRSATINQLAYATRRWFSRASTRDKLLSHGAFPLRWEVARSGTGASCHDISLTSRHVPVVPAFENRHSQGGP